jgi:hypothetical protein
MAHLLRQPSWMGRPAERPTLETWAEGAGRAWACAFSSSAEFDAALIAERRAEGRYGPRRNRRTFLALIGIVAGLAVMTALAVLF